MSSRSFWRLAAAVTAAVLVVIAFVGIDRPIGNDDEVIYAENVREMRRTGDWGVLTYQGEPGLLRPAAPFVPVVLVSSVVEGEVGLRLVQVLWFLAILALVFATARRAWGRIDLALLATVLCASIPTMLVFGRALFSDPALVTATTFALYATLRAQDDPRWLLGIAAGLGAGVAFKSLAPAVPGVALSPWIILAIVRHRPWKILAGSVALFVALAAPYFVYSYLRFGDQFLSEHLGLSLGSRVGGKTRVGMEGGLAAYLIHVVESDGPAAAAWMGTTMIAGAVLAWRRRDRALGLMVGYAAAILVLMSLVGTRLPHYLMPAYPAVALAAAGTLRHLAAHVRGIRPPLRAGIAGAVAATLLLLGLVQPIYPLLRPAPQVVELGAAAAEVTPEAEPVYSLNWYAPALGYYADREWHLLSTEPKAVEHLGGIYLFRLAGNIHPVVPPWPAAPFTVAGFRAELEAAGLLGRGAIVAEAGDWAVVRLAP